MKVLLYLASGYTWTCVQTLNTIKTKLLIDCQISLIFLSYNLYIIINSTLNRMFIVFSALQMWLLIYLILNLFI